MNQNLIKQFLNEEIFTDKKNEYRAKELYDKYKVWSARFDKIPYGRNKFFDLIKLEPCAEFKHRTSGDYFIFDAKKKLDNDAVEKNNIEINNLAKNIITDLKNIDEKIVYVLDNWQSLNKNNLEEIMILLKNHSGVAKNWKQIEDQIKPKEKKTYRAIGRILNFLYDEIYNSPVEKYTGKELLKKYNEWRQKKDYNKHHLVDKFYYVLKKRCSWLEFKHESTGNYFYIKKEEK